MKHVITAETLERHLQNGRDVEEVTRGAILTPSAKDLLRERGRAASAAGGARGPSGAASGARPPEPTVPDREYRWTPGADPETPEALQRFYDSPEIRSLRETMVDIGGRIWQRGYVDGNGGNLTVRVGDNLVLCTPTLVSKGAMKPDDMCLVDFEGRQFAGKRKRTSECLTHLAIMKRQPDAKACCHAHPPHATAFAVAGVQPPTCMIPEAEVFLGEIGMAEYQTPGTDENARVVGEAAVEHMSVLMKNHGVITWGKDIEDAYWKMENTDAYCQTVWIATQLGGEPQTISQGQARELIELRDSLGMHDRRSAWKECELCDNQEFRPGVVCVNPGDSGGGENGGADAGDFDPEAEEIVRRITDTIMNELSG